MSLLLAVLDVNDETPTFFPAVYNVSVSEDVSREFRVVWLNCTDNDVGLNAELSYFITGKFPCCAALLTRTWTSWGQKREKGAWTSTLMPPQGLTPGSQGASRLKVYRGGGRQRGQC